MGCFRDFTAPLWQVFSGNLLLLFCSLFYLIWWVVSFRPGSSGGAAGALCLAGAFITGIAAIALMSVGITSLSQISNGIQVRYILIGAAVLYVLLLLITVTVFHRQVTSELLIMLIWAALELSAIAVLRGTGRFVLGSFVTAAALIAVATIIGLICYVLYYRLDGMASYQVGMVPLITDAAVMAIFLGIFAFA